MENEKITNLCSIWPQKQTERRVSVENQSQINIRRMKRQTICELCGDAAGPSIQTWRMMGHGIPDCVPDPDCNLLQDGPEPQPRPQPEPESGCSVHTWCQRKDTTENKLQSWERQSSDQHIWNADFSISTFTSLEIVIFCSNVQNFVENSGRHSKRHHIPQQL